MCTPLVYWKDGTIVHLQRPAAAVETIFRPGQEVFLCPSQRPTAIGKIFILLGVFLSNPKNVLSSHTLLLDVMEYENRKSREFPQPEKFFRTCPLKFMAKVPGGRAFEETEPMVRECVPMLQSFFMTFVTDATNLSCFDFLVKDYGSKQGRHSHNTRNIASKSEPPLTPKMLPKCENSNPTPPYASRIEKRILDLGKSIAGSLENQQAVAKLEKQFINLTNKNKQLLQAKEDVDNKANVLQKEVDKLKAEICDLQNSNARQTAEIAILRMAAPSLHSQMAHLNPPPYAFPGQQHVNLQNVQPPFSFGYLQSPNSSTSNAPARSKSQKKKSRAKKSKPDKKRSSSSEYSSC